MCICLIFEGTSPLQINYKHHFTDKLPSFSCPDSWYLQLQLTLILTKASHIKHFAKFNTNLQIWARSVHQTSCLVNQMNMLQIFCKKGYKSKSPKLIFWLKFYSILMRLMFNFPTQIQINWKFLLKNPKNLKIVFWNNLKQCLKTLALVIFTFWWLQSEDDVS